MSEATTIDFELVSPERKLVEEPVKMAVIPGQDGEFGVGAGHCSLVSSLRPGIVALYTEGNAEPQRIFVAGGFADVTGSLCTVLAEEAVNVNDLNKQDVEAELISLGEALSEAEEEVEKVRIQRKIVIAKARLSAVTGELQL